MKPAANGRYLVCRSLDTTLLFKFTVPKHIYPSISKVHAGSFRVSVIHQTLTWTAGSITCVHDYSYACIYTQGCMSIVVEGFLLYLPSMSFHHQLCWGCLHIVLRWKTAVGKLCLIKQIKSHLHISYVAFCSHHTKLVVGIVLC